MALGRGKGKNRKDKNRWEEVSVALRNPVGSEEQLPTPTQLQKHTVFSVLFTFNKSTDPA